MSVRSQDVTIFVGYAQNGETVKPNYDSVDLDDIETLDVDSQVILKTMLFEVRFRIEFFS